MNLPRDQYLILSHLQTTGRSATVDELVAALQLDQVFVSGAIQTLEAGEWLTVSEEAFQEVKIGKEGQPYLDAPLPEKTIAAALAATGGTLPLSQLSATCGLDQKVVGKNLKVLLEKGWVTKEGPALSLTAQGKQASKTAGADEQLFTLLKEKGSIFACNGPDQKFVSQQAEPVFFDAEKNQLANSFIGAGFELLKKRSQFLNIKDRIRKSVSLTESGRARVAAGISEQIDATGLTPELLKDSRWKDVQFKPYDIQAEAQQVYPGKIHPYQKILNATRRIYLEMGFTEIASPHVESAFWGFDALFQPQDHPARDMQDTFYMKAPYEAKLPDQTLVDEVRDTHEYGGKTGSAGWRYKWSQEMAKRIVLRTHTTAASIQQIHLKPGQPQKVFCIGRVFRRETVDYKHLPVFTQVDGIVVDPKVSLAHLIGIIREFYHKMGFEKIEVRPAFFPYTEPSLEIFVYMEERKDWVEMGGAGIFRKEVTLPMGCDMPVLAWGLGLERLAMFKYNLSDIRDIYIANIKWLREVSACQW